MTQKQKFITIKNAYEYYLLHHKASGSSVHTIDFYERRLPSFFADFNYFHINEISAKDIRQYLSDATLTPVPSSIPAIVIPIDSGGSGSGGSIGGGRGSTLFALERGGIMGDGMYLTSEAGPELILNDSGRSFSVLNNRTTNRIADVMSSMVTGIGSGFTTSRSMFGASGASMAGNTRTYHYDNRNFSNTDARTDARSITINAPTQASFESSLRHIEAFG